jgi:hypothetical protein
MFAKSLILNKLNLPVDVISMVKDYAFNGIRRLPKDDMRYKLLSKIPEKEYDPSDGVTYVYMTINNSKDYFLTYSNFELQLQTLQYDDDNMIYAIEGHSTIIE